MTDLNQKLNETQPLVNNDKSTGYFTVKIPENVYHYQQLQEQREYEFEKKIVFVRNSNVLKHNLYVTFIILFIVFILCFAILGILCFADTIKNSDSSNDDV